MYSNRCVQVTFGVVFMAIFLGSVLRGYAQGTDSDEFDLNQSGNRPEFSNLLFFVRANDTEGTSWFFTEDAVWSFSLDSLTWTKWPAVTADDFELRADYDPSSNQFLFWNRGVGKVYEWRKGEISLRRIDRSSHHRTQFGHAGFVHPKTGEIYAFGGYGFWQSKGFTTRYDRQTNEWQIVTLDVTKPYPSARSESMHTYDPQSDEFHIFGGQDYRHDGREDLSVDFIYFDDYWIFNLPRREWRQVPVYGLKSVGTSSPTIPGILKQEASSWRTPIGELSAVVDTVNRLAWYPIVNADNMNDFQLLVFDQERSFGAVTPIKLETFDKNRKSKWFTYDAPRNRIVVFWIPNKSDIEVEYVNVSALPLPHPDSTRAMMDMIRTYGSVNPPERAFMWWILPALLVLLGGSGWYWVRRQRHLRDIEADRASQALQSSGASAQPPELVFYYLGEPRLLLNGTDVRIAFSDSEFNMLLWLFWRRQMGEKYQVTDDIEEAFWPNTPNSDYVRKQRNSTLRRLSNQLSDLMKSYFPDHNWLADRSTFVDKRKREYALQFDPVAVSWDLDEFGDVPIYSDSILTGCSGVWAEEIRSGILSKQADSLLNRAPTID